MLDGTFFLVPTRLLPRPESLEAARKVGRDATAREDSRDGECSVAEKTDDDDDAAADAAERRGGPRRPTTPDSSPEGAGSDAWLRWAKRLKSSSKAPRGNSSSSPPLRRLASLVSSLRKGSIG